MLRLRRMKPIPYYKEPAISSFWEILQLQKVALYIYRLCVGRLSCRTTRSQHGHHKGRRGRHLTKHDPCRRHIPDTTPLPRLQCRQLHPGHTAAVPSHPHAQLCPRGT